MLVIHMTCNVLYLKIDRDNITTTTTIPETVQRTVCFCF